ncbi:MAG: hypothetical protein WA766_11730 [Candidatus Acidiferrales bacterium]
MSTTPNPLPSSSAANTGSAVTNPSQLNLFPTVQTIIPKCIHSGTDWVGQPYVYLDQSSAAMRSKLGQGVTVDNVFGVTLSGPLGIFENPENIHLGGGYWTLNPVLLESIGSCAAVPVPVLIPDTPRLLSAAQQVSSSVSTLQSADPSIPAGD